ncbi:MAG: hypothetical protein IKU08_07220 [Clostridia bacterium]|nr:hypothetical protein [Clostridia bacterium]
MKKTKEMLGKSYVPCVVFVCIAFVTCLLRLVIGIMDKNDISLWLFGISSEEIMLALGAVSGYSTLFFFSFYLSSKKSKHKAVIAVVSFAVSVLLMIEVVFIYSRQPEYEYFKIVSDDKQHEIIIKEGSYLLSGAGAFYEKTSPITMVKIGEYSTDDGYRPFSDNRYEIDWNENGFEVTYSFDSSAKTKKETAQYAK